MNETPNAIETKTQNNFDQIIQMILNSFMRSILVMSFESPSRASNIGILLSNCVKSTARNKICYLISSVYSPFDRIDIIIKRLAF